MANNMDSFDFDALDSAALDETLSFLNNYDPSSPPDPSFAGFEGLGDPMMDWPVIENTTWAPFGNVDFSGGVTNALTESSIPGSHLPNPGREFQNQPHQPHQSMGAETPLDFGESRNNNSFPIIPASQMPLSDFSTIRESILQGSEHNVSYPGEFYPSMDKKPLLCLACDWPSCKSITIYGTLRDLQNHQTDVHIAEILKDWPGSCSWPGCNSKISFKTGKRLEDHVYNIHITPLCCTAPGCAHKRPFERQADLERHVASKHTKERKYKCPYYPKCDQPGFSRKDKLKQHERTYHGQFACTFNHCIYGSSSEEILQKHKSSWRTHHRGYFECGLGSCVGTSASLFIWSALKQHLEHDHLLSSEAIQKAMGNFRYRRVTVTPAHFPDGLSGFQDCKSCIEKLKEAAAGEGGQEEE